MNKKILIIDDQEKVYKSLSRNFRHHGYQTLYASKRKTAIDLISQQTPSVVLLDIMLGEENGIDVLKTILMHFENIQVIMITGFGSIETAVKSIKHGAYEYVTKPIDFEKLLNIVENAFRIVNLGNENKNLKQIMLETAPKIITQSPKMEQLQEKIKVLAISELPVLISGENGTGKEIIADYIHLYSKRNSLKMQKINCSAFPESLLDNELFGHEKGAYTGAETSFKGVFEQSEGSTLFLDEIGDMPLTVQAKILRTLQNSEIRRIGGEKIKTINVRFVAATNKDLNKLINQGKFREDLYFRLNAAKLIVPPLRERKEDIPVLIDHFLSEFADQSAIEKKQVSDQVFEILLNYEWPGNVRELKNTINYMATISSDNTIMVKDFPVDFFDVPPPSQQSINLLEDTEKALIIRTLQRVGYNKKKTAELLSLSRNTLYSRIKKYGITIP